MKNSIIAFLLMVFSLATPAQDNLQFRGALVKQPCTIAPGDEVVNLNFGSIIDSFLYQYQRTPAREFLLRLTQCEPIVGRDTKITFSGQANTALPGYLALSAGSQAKGVALGIESAQGVLLPINDKSIVNVVSGDNILTFKTFIQGEPLALQNRTIGLGAFQANATFTLEYE